MIKFLDLAAQYQTIKQEIDTAIHDVITKSVFIGGEYVSKFEREFADYINVTHCIGVANGTDAIEIAIEALNLPHGSEIIVPANSFIASSEPVTRQGHRVVFADCDSQSYVISIEDIKKRITPNTKAIIAVHLYGHPCDMDSLQDLAKHMIFLSLKIAHNRMVRNTKAKKLDQLEISLPLASIQAKTLELMAMAVPSPLTMLNWLKISHDCQPWSSCKIRSSV
jgi:hypothetical protein